MFGQLILSSSTRFLHLVLTSRAGQFTTDFNKFAAGTTSPSAFRDRVDDYTLYYIYIFIARLVLAYTSNVIK